MWRCSGRRYALAEHATNHSHPIHNRVLILVDPPESFGGGLLHLLQGGRLYGVEHRLVGHILCQEVVQAFGLVDVAVAHKQALHLQASFAGWVNRSNHFLLDFVLCTPKHRFIFFGRCPVGAVRSKTAPRDTLSGFSR